MLITPPVRSTSGRESRSASPTRIPDTPSSPSSAWKVAGPKTRASHRTIPLLQVVADTLAAHLAAFPAEPDALVFTQSGKPISRSTFGYRWRAAVKKAKLPHGTGFHALRHYYASLLIRHGESVKTVQARLGHASAVETLDTYSHLWPDSDDRTRDAIDWCWDLLRTDCVLASPRRAEHAGHLRRGGRVGL